MPSKPPERTEREGAAPLVRGGRHVAETSDPGAGSRSGGGHSDRQRLRTTQLLQHRHHRGQSFEDRKKPLTKTAERHADALTSRPIAGSRPHVSPPGNRPYIHQSGAIFTLYEGKTGTRLSAEPHRGDCEFCTTSRHSAMAASACAPEEQLDRPIPRRTRRDLILGIGRGAVGTIRYAGSDRNFPSSDENLPQRG